MEAFDIPFLIRFGRSIRPSRAQLGPMTRLSACQRPMRLGVLIQRVYSEGRVVELVVGKMQRCSVGNHLVRPGVLRACDLLLRDC
jgi:hypothetical protein